MQEKFRAEFASVLHFKFFTEENLQKHQTKLKKNQDAVKFVKEQLKHAEKRIDKFQEINGSFFTDIEKFEKMLKAQN